MNNMKTSPKLSCAVVTPIGPGHEQVYYDFCVKSIRAAIQKSKGPFEDVYLFPVEDFQGNLGRSRARNIGVNLAKVNNIDWIFFLDADDFMFELAFENLHDYVASYDAVWGQIVEMSVGNEGSAKLREGQVSNIENFETIINNDPFYTLQMGHFVRTETAANYPFDETMDTGEDFKYYLEVWQAGRCLKSEKIFFVNVRGNHSTGPRSANGSQWRKAVEQEINYYKN